MFAFVDDKTLKTNSTFSKCNAMHLLAVTFIIISPSIYRFYCACRFNGDANKREHIQCAYLLGLKYFHSNGFNYTNIARHTLRFARNPLFRIMSWHYFMWFYEPGFANKTFLFSVLFKDVASIFLHVSAFASVDSDLRTCFFTIIAHLPQFTHYAVLVFSEQCDTMLCE